MNFRSRVGLLLVALACWIMLCDSSNIVETIGSLNDQNTTEVSERLFRQVDTIENSIRALWNTLSRHNNLVRSSFGLLILFYGGEFCNTIIFTQALMITGWPIISKYASTLYQSYKINRDALRKELPDIIKAQADVADLALAIETDSRLLKQLETKLSTNKLSKLEFSKQADPIKTKLNKAKALMQKTKAVQNSIGHLKHSLHIQHLQDALSALYQSITVGIASVSSQTLGAVTMGLNVGKLVHVWAQRLFNRWRRTLELDDSDEREVLLEKNAEWLSAAVLSASRLAGVLLSLCLANTFSAVSQCALGSHLLAEAAEAWLDPLLQRLHLPAIHNTPALDIAVHSLFFALGMRRMILAAVFGIPQTPLPSILKILLAPLRVFEFILSKFVISR